MWADYELADALAQKDLERIPWWNLYALFCALV